jgi:GH25 family lysozyme M1 (1,4-beta-N-acetylmuramidase)
MLIVDLSNHNATPDFRSFKAHGVEGVWFKATEGVGFVDGWNSAWTGLARKAGLRVGWYHFAHPGNDPVKEADFFSKHVGSFARRDLRAVLDYEPAGDVHHEAWIRAWNARVFKNLKVGPLFYSNTARIKEMGLKVPVGYGLWLADYGRNDGQVHPVHAPAPWKTIAAHQYTSTGRVGTYGPVDKSIVLAKRTVLAHPVLGWV